MEKRAILLDRPEDYKRLGIHPEQIEEWEDGVRDTSKSNHFEWWYFDCMLNNGMKVVVQFLSKNGRSIASDKFHPTIFFKITMPDGRQIDREYRIAEKDIFWSKDTCEIHFGPHSFIGNLKHYRIHMELKDGMAADLELDSTGKPYRPGTSYFQFGEERQYYTWLCVVPRGCVSGTVTVEGKTIPVSGSGYHDHQWGSINFHKYWNHWIWARQGFEDCSLLLFDFFTNEEYGSERFPIVFIQDKDGNIIFDSSHGVKCSVKERYIDDASGKEYPSKLVYEFENNGKKAEYILTAKKTIEKKGMKNMPLPMKLAMKAMGIQPSYTRYVADGRLVFSAEDTHMEREGSLIYEVMCPGTKCAELMDTEAVSL